MLQQARHHAGRVDLVAARGAEVLRHTRRVLDREVVPRLGYPGMVALTLLVFALIQAVLPKWTTLGGASLPLLWCAIVYYTLRFRIRRGIVAACAGSLLSCLVYDAPVLATGVATLVLTLSFLFLGQWLLAEFWPAHAMASALFALLMPIVAWIIGVPTVYTGVGSFFGTLLTAPLVAIAVFVALEWTRRFLGITILFDDEEEAERTASECVRRPSLARGAGT